MKDSAERLEKLLNDLAKPIFNWRMARGYLAGADSQRRHGYLVKEGKIRGAEKRREKALSEAQKLLEAYHEGS